MDQAADLRRRVLALAEAYREYGYLAADLDPLGLMPRDRGNLALERFGLAGVDPDTPVALTLAPPGCFR